MTNNRIHLIIPAAGSGTRFGGTVPKQYMEIHSKAILRHTVEKFINLPGLVSITIPINPKDEDMCKNALQGLSHINIIHGGNTRKESVYNALLGFANVKDEDIIMIHDAARPLIDTKDVQNLASTLAKDVHTQAATLAVPVADTINRAVRGSGDDNSNKDTYGKNIERAGTWAIQTPQGFTSKTIMQAHERFKEDNSFTDDAGMVSAMGVKVAIVQGKTSNFKITTMEDFKMAEKLLSTGAQTLTTTENRTGTGYDVHAFDLDNKPENSDTFLTLCGIKIPHNRGLKGHSDADVAMHAITDALLGAIGAGDIGRHFPPSDEMWKNADSSIFLEKALSLIKEQEGEITNIDTTIICETPKITPYKNKMIENIARILQIGKSRVSIKATTTEGLGFTGRKEGIAAMAVANIQLPKGRK